MADVVVAVVDRLRGEALLCLRSRVGRTGKPVVLVVNEFGDDENLIAIECGVAAVVPRRTLTHDRCSRRKG